MWIGGDATLAPLPDIAACTLCSQSFRLTLPFVRTAG
jgi:hypothetical protein